MRFKLISFELGRVCATPGALAAIQSAGEDPAAYLAAHQEGAPGDLCAEDVEANLRARESGYRILSAFTTATGARLFVITEADRSYTTVLLRSEY